MTIDTRLRRDRKIARNLRVFLDGVEVTNRCFYADGRRGVVRLYRLNANGHKFLEPVAIDGQGRLRWAVATEERRGKVRWGRVAA